MIISLKVAIYIIIPLHCAHFSHDIHVGVYSYDITQQIKLMCHLISVHLCSTYKKILTICVYNQGHKIHHQKHENGNSHHHSYLRTSC
jgi:hypothetical protein